MSRRAALVGARAVRRPRRDVARAVDRRAAVRERRVDRPDARATDESRARRGGVEECGRRDERRDGRPSRLSTRVSRAGVRGDGVRARVVVSSVGSARAERIRRADGGAERVDDARERVRVVARRRRIHLAVRVSPPMAERMVRAARPRERANRGRRRVV